MKKTIHLALTSMLVFSASLVFAGGGAPPPPPPPGEASAPIDNGALILLAAVAFYGYRKLRHKEQTAEE